MLTIFAVFLTLVGLILVGIPIAYAMLLAAVLGFWLSGYWPSVALIAQRVYYGINSFVLLAVPFYIFTGLLMNEGGMTEKIVEFAQLLVGRFRGGLAQVNIVDSMIFAGMSGSSVADASGFGAVDIELMCRGGYDRPFAAALTAAASTVGPVIPPSIPFVIYGAMTGVSVGALFLGGIVPGVLMGLVMMLAVYLVARRRGYASVKRRYTLKEALVITGHGILAFGSMILIIGGLLAGAFTPTEAGVAACAYALLVTGLVYRRLNLRLLITVLQKTAYSSAKILFIIGAATAYTYICNLLGIPNLLVKTFSNLITHPALLLLTINVLLLVLGCFMETISIMLLVVPVLLPLIRQAGIDPVHFGVMLTLNLMIGQLTPPFGILLYAVCSTAQVQIKDVIKNLWMFIAALIVALILVSYVPSITLWIPRLVGR